MTSMKSGTRRSETTLKLETNMKCKRGAVQEILQIITSTEVMTSLTELIAQIRRSGRGTKDSKGLRIVTARSRCLFTEIEMWWRALGSLTSLSNQMAHTINLSGDQAEATEVAISNTLMIGIMIKNHSNSLIMIREMGSRNRTIVGMNVRSKIITKGSRTMINISLAKTSITGVPNNIIENNALGGHTSSSISPWVEEGPTIA